MRNLSLIVGLLSMSFTNLAVASNINCDAKVGQIYQYDRDGQTVWGSDGAQNQSYYRKQFPENAGDKLTLEEIAKIRWTERGDMVDNMRVYGTLPVVNADVDSDEVLAFINVNSASKELADGNYVKITSQKYQADTFFVDTIAFRNHKAVIHAHMSLSTKDRNGGELVYTPEYAVENARVEKEDHEDMRAIKEGKLSREDALKRFKQRHNEMLANIGEGKVTSLMIHCSLD